MKLLDKYILKRFLTAYFFAVLIILSIIIVIDFTEKNDNFVEHGLKMSQILGYYKLVIPYFANFISPLMIFIAAIFVSAKMAGHTEIVAILSNGVSFARMIVPFLVGAMFVGLLNFYLQGWVIPDFNKEKINFEIQYIERPFNYSDRNIHFQESENIFLYMQSYVNNIKRGNKFSLERIENTILKEKLTGDYIEWNEDSSRWTIKNWKLMVFDSLGENITKGKEMDTVLRIRPQDFENNYRKWETLTMHELDDHVAELNARGAMDAPVFKIEKQVRYMSPFTYVILTFLALIVASRKTRGGTGVQIAVGFLLAFFFIILYILSRSIAESSTLPYILVVWFPNILFAVISLLLYKILPR